MNQPLSNHRGVGKNPPTGGPPPSGDEWPQLATYPQSPFSGPEALLRRSVPVPGILAAHRPGAIMDKSGHHFVARYP